MFICVYTYAHIVIYICIYINYTIDKMQLSKILQDFFFQKKSIRQYYMVNCVISGLALSNLSLHVRHMLFFTNTYLYIVSGLINLPLLEKVLRELPCIWYF